MGIGNKKSIPASELRRRAEERLNAEAPEAGYPPSEVEAQRLLHELQVHQIELEMQNAELRQSRDDVETALEKYTDLYDFAPVGYLTLDRDGTVRAVNLTGAAILRFGRSRLLGRQFEHLVAASDRPVYAEYLRNVVGKRVKDTCEVALLKEGRHPFCVQIKAVAAVSGEGLRLAFIDISEQKQLQEDLALKVVQLEAALCKVKQLEGIIPICSYCKKIRDDKEIWHKLETYITEHSEAAFSHGICPDCFESAMGDVQEKKEMDG